MNRQLLVFLIPTRLACRGCSDRPANQNPQYAGYCCQGCEAGADHEDWCMPVAPQTESPQPAEGCYGCCPTLVAEVERLRAELAKACTDCGSPDRGGRALKQDNEQDDVYRGLRGRKSSGTYRLSLSHKRSTIEQIKRVMQESLTTALLFEPLDARTIQKAETLLSEALSPQWLATQGVHEAMIRAAGYASENRLDVHLYYQFEDDPTTRVITYTLLPGRSEIHV